MKKNSKKIVIGLILLQFFLGACAMTTEVQSFGNEGFSGKINILRDSRINWLNSHYGTHDWIGDGALDAVVKLDNWVFNDKIFWTTKRRWIFLIGTEAPDAGYNQLNIRLNKWHHHGMKTVSKINFYPSTYSDDIRLGPKGIFYPRTISDAYRYTKEVLQYLRWEECDSAAFYMGALCHLIGDMSTFTHISEDSYHSLDSSYEYTIGCKTSDWDYRRREDTFKYPESNEYSFEGFRVPMAIVLETAFYTMWNVHAGWEDIIASPKPASLQAGTPNADTLCDYLESNPGGWNNWPNALRDAAQRHLKQAVISTAEMISFFKPFWTGNCQNDDDGGNSQSPNSGSGRGLGRGMANAMMMMISIGIAQVLLAPVIQTILATMNRGI